MMDDTNVNPIWDMITGDSTTGAMPRMLGVIAVFILVGGTISWLVI
jgi:hypothetical protein